MVSNCLKIYTSMAKLHCKLIINNEKQQDSFLCLRNTYLILISPEFKYDIGFCSTRKVSKTYALSLNQFNHFNTFYIPNYTVFIHFLPRKKYIMKSSNTSSVEQPSS